MVYALGGGILSHVSGDGALLRVRHTFEGERGARREKKRDPEGKREGGQEGSRGRERTTHNLTQRRMTHGHT